MELYKKELTRYSPIANIDVLEELFKCDALGNYLLLLAHEVIKTPERYSDLIESVRDEEGAFIIMDNGAVELGSPITPNDPRFHDALAAVEPDCYVLPDVLRNFKGTRDAILLCADRIHELNTPFMAIPQGKGALELVACVQWISDNLPSNPHPVYGDLWGVPRWITNETGSRMPLLQYINAYQRALEKPHAVHLFGMSQNYEDDIRCTGNPYVIGIDSANPVMLGQQGMLMEKMEHKQHIDRGTLWNRPYTPPEVKDNICYVRERIKIAHPAGLPGVTDAK